MADDLKTQLDDAQAALDGEVQDVKEAKEANVAEPLTPAEGDDSSDSSTQDVASVVEEQTENPEMETMVEDSEAAPETTEEQSEEIAASPEVIDREAQTESAPRNDNEEVTEETAEPSTPAEGDDSPDSSEPVDAPVVDAHPNARWYVVHTYSGHENRVAQTLKQRVEAEHLEDKIVEVLVPTQEKIEIRGGKKEQVKEKIFPGYLLVRMVMDDDSWVAVRTTQGVTSFIGMSNKPTPIPAAEVQSILKFMQQGGQPTYKQAFNDGDTVKIVDGPFTEFIGKIDNVDKERGKVRVLVSIFGRETPVELDFLQVQKL